MFGVRILFFAFFQLLFFSATAQDQPSRSAATPAAPIRLPSPKTTQEPPPPVANKPPVQFFRELLAMTFDERVEALASRTPEDRKQILAKVREYLAMPGPQREYKLQATELRYYLLRLMRLSATNRATQLEAMPVFLRKSVEDRLRLWDELSLDVQKDFMAKQASLAYWTELAGQTNSPAKSELSPERQALLEKGIQGIQALPDDERQKLMARFNQFFELTPKEKDLALNTLSEPERLQMEKTLRNYGQLTPEQRVQCVHSFEKFASMSLQERNQFLRNAERWKLMTAEQREAWREIVSKAPMLPFISELPPLPRPGVSHKPSSRPVATNN